MTSCRNKRFVLSFLMCLCDCVSQPESSGLIESGKNAQPWSIQDRGGLYSEDLFFGSDEVVSLDIKFDDSYKHRLEFAFVTLRGDDKEWDDYAQSQIWHSQGQTYAQITFPNATSKEPRTFELSQNIDQERNQRLWRSVWENEMYVRYTTMSIALHWNPSVSYEKVNQNYSKVHLIVWNTYAGVIIDQKYIVNWDDLGNYRSHCPPPILPQEYLRCEPW